MRRVDQRIGPADALVAEVDANTDELPGDKLRPLGGSPGKNACHSARLSHHLATGAIAPSITPVPAAPVPLTG